MCDASVSVGTQAPAARICQAGLLLRSLVCLLWQPLGGRSVGGCVQCVMCSALRFQQCVFLPPPQEWGGLFLRLGSLGVFKHVRL